MYPQIRVKFLQTGHSGIFSSKNNPENTPRETFRIFWEIIWHFFPKFFGNYLAFSPRNIPQKYTRETFGIFLKIIWHFFPKFLCHSLPKEMPEKMGSKMTPTQFGKTQNPSHFCFWFSWILEYCSSCSAQGIPFLVKTSWDMCKIVKENPSFARMMVLWNNMWQQGVVGYFVLCCVIASILYVSFYIVL